MLLNKLGVGVSYFPKKNVMKVYGSMLFALRGVLNFHEKNVT